MAPRTTRDFQPSTQSVGDARHFVVAEAQLAEEPSQRLALAVSEVVSNAVLHGRTPYRVGVQRRGNTLVVDVTDANPSLPVRTHHCTLAPTGRGLRIIDRLVDRWGVEVEGPGKTVWFEFSAENHHKGDDSTQQGP